MIKHLNGFTVKHNEKYLIWLLKNLKKVYKGIDSLGNKGENYFNALKYFVKMIHGPLGRDNGYTKRARLTIETLILYGGHHVLCSLDTMELADQANPLEKGTTSEEE